MARRRFKAGARLVLWGGRSDRGGRVGGEIGECEEKGKAIGNGTGLLM